MLRGMMSSRLSPLPPCLAHSQADPSSLQVEKIIVREIRARPLFAAMVGMAMAHGNTRQELSASESLGDRMMDFQQLANEVFSDLLKRDGRPTDVVAVLTQRRCATARCK
jgi:hypothetical protein